MPEWCEGDDVISLGASWTPNIGQAPELHAGKESFSWQILQANVPEKYYLSPAHCSRILICAMLAGCPPPKPIEEILLKQGGAYPSSKPFPDCECAVAPSTTISGCFSEAFGKRTDPFPTLLASELYPFAFWYEDDPSGGCVRFLTETECERLMGLPEGWTKYGADGREICSTNRYTALGNAIALPCAEYIMAGIAEVLGK